ncbi:MAG: YajQ family cyclic di-GMP-binding protein [Candidatus Nomurabacteria bacterium]|nr:MAG: YajQ family cyclic di-GMP-binding protein [Candidatus Nomurabacteria bacterium]
MAQFSFDVVSEFDKAEMNNVLDQVQREISNRYDFKGTPARIEWLDTNKTGFKITGNSDYQLEAIIDIVRKKLASRNIDQKVLDASQEPIVANLKSTKNFPFVQGLNQEKAKQITKLLRDEIPKVKAQVQGETVRVMSSKKDELQTAMQTIRSKDLPFPINFTNFK